MLNLGDIVKYIAPNNNEYILKVKSMRPVGRGFRVECIDSKGNEHTLPASNCVPAPDQEFQFNDDVPLSVKSKAMTPDEMKSYRKMLRATGKAAIVPDWSRYINNGVSKDNGDTIAMALRECSNSADLYKKAIGMGLPSTFEELEARYSHLNFGMQRMNIGNRLRGIKK